MAKAIDALIIKSADKGADRAIDLNLLRIIFLR